MNIANCKNCHKIIQYEKIPICRECEENYLNLVISYIKTNGISSYKEVSEATNVPLKVIEYFVEENIISEVLEPQDVPEEKINNRDQLMIVGELKKAFENEALRREMEKQEEKKIKCHYTGKRK